MPDVVLAVDIGGTKTAAALVDRAGVLRDTVAAPTPGRRGPAAIIDTVVDLAGILRSRTPEALTICAVGVGTAGVVDVGRGTILSATDTLAGWAGTALGADLTAALSGPLGTRLPIHVQNDVDAYAFGELHAGAAVGSSSALMIAVGTGVGASVIANGEIVRGSRHVAGEIAHMPIPGAAHLRCPCGRMGHLEALGSGIGMHAHYLSLGGDPAVTDARGIVARAAEGDELAAAALSDSAASVGRAIAGAVTLLDPERVILSGGVVAAGTAWWRPMETALRAELIDVLQSVPVVAGTLGDAAPLRGAAAAAWNLIEGRQ